VLCLTSPVSTRKLFSRSQHGTERDGFLSSRYEIWRTNRSTLSACCSTCVSLVQRSCRRRMSPYSTISSSGAMLLKCSTCCKYGMCWLLIRTSTRKRCISCRRTLSIPLACSLFDTFLVLPYRLGEKHADFHYTIAVCEIFSQMYTVVFSSRPA
jgi:hypothetical protein